jgi:uncharacterized protein YbaP (TraB family)
LSPAGIAAVADVVAAALDEVADVVVEADVVVASFCASFDPHPDNTRPATATADATETA